MNTRARGNSSRPIGRLLIFVWAVLLVGVTGAKAAPVETLVQDTLYRADGSVARGSITVRWNGFSTQAGAAVAAGQLTVKTDAKGGISIPLIANTGSTPSGSYYRVVIKLDDGTTSEEIWVVPAVTTTTIAAIRAKVVPQAVAAQFASRDYVDSELATVVHLDGAETIEGAKTFVPSPVVPVPTVAGGAANKGYVDQAIAGLGSGDLSDTATLARQNAVNTFTANQLIKYSGPDGTSPLLVNGTSSAMSGSAAIQVLLPAAGGQNALVASNAADTYSWFSLTNKANGFVGSGSSSGAISTQPGIEFGPGGATAHDTFLYRSSAGTLSTPGSFGAGGAVTAQSVNGTSATFSGSVAAGTVAPGAILQSYEVPTTQWPTVSSAIAAIVASGVGGNVYVNPGLYNEAVTLPDNGTCANLYGVGGPGAVTVKTTNGSTVLSKGGSSNANGCHVEGITFDGGEAATIVAQFLSGQNWVVRNNIFTGSAAGVDSAVQLGGGTYEWQPLDFSANQVDFDSPYNYALFGYTVLSGSGGSVAAAYPASKTSYSWPSVPAIVEVSGCLTSGTGATYTPVLSGGTSGTVTSITVTPNSGVYSCAPLIGFVGAGIPPKYCYHEFNGAAGGDDGVYSANVCRGAVVAGKRSDANTGMNRWINFHNYSQSEFAVEDYGNDINTGLYDDQPQRADLHIGNALAVYDQVNHYGSFTGVPGEANTILAVVDSGVNTANIDGVARGHSRRAVILRSRK